MTMSLLFGKTLFRVVNTIFASERMTILCWVFLTLISYGFIMNLDNGFYSKNGNDTVLSPEPIGQVDHSTTGVMSCGCVCCTSVDLDPECTTTI
jgi:hypothetical protein